MKTKIEPRDDHQITLVVELPSELLEGAKHRAARKISERKSIPGFRPGKAPYDVVVRNFGENIIKDEAVDLLLDEVYPKALEEAKIEPGAAGSLEKVENLDTEPIFTFTVPLQPSIDLGNYRSIRLPYEWNAPADEKVEEAMDELRHMYAKTETVDRPIQTGDFVMIDLKGINKNTAGDTAPLIEKKGTPVFIQPDGKEDEFPFKGFSKELVGLSLEDTKSTIHKYNKDYKDESLQGKTVNFTVKINMVRGTILPELNDDFAKQVGPFENLQAMRDVIKANLEARSKNDYEDEYYSLLMDKVKEIAAIKYPPQLLSRELEDVMKDLKSRLAQQNMDLVAYLKSREMDEEKFVAEEARPAAIKRLERSLLIETLAKEEKIEVSKEVLQSTFEQTWGAYQGDSNFKKLMRGKSQPPKQLINTVAIESANRAYVQQTFTRLKEIATGKNVDLPRKIKGDFPKVKKTPKTISPGIKKGIVQKKSSNLQQADDQESEKEKRPVKRIKKTLPVTTKEAIEKKDAYT